MLTYIFGIRLFIFKLTFSIHSFSIVKLLYLSCLLILIVHFSYGQTSSQPGYIVATTGDTIRGVLASQNGQRSAQDCQFKPAGQSKFLTYTPAQLRGYGSADHAYRTYPVATEAQFPEPKFLAVVEQGPASLFLLVDAGGHERFFINGALGTVTELRQVIRARPDLGSNIKETNNFYRSELKRAFQSCPSAQRYAQQVSFNLAALQRAVQRYNTCQQPGASQPGASQPAARNSSWLRLSATYNLPIYNVLRLGEGKQRVPADDKVKGKYYVSAGVLLSIGSRYHSSHVFFISGLLCEINRTYSTQQAYPNLSYNIFYQNSQVDVSLDYLKLPLLVRYSWSGNKLLPYVEAGLYLRALLAMRRNAVSDTYSLTSPNYSRAYPLLDSHQGITPAPAVGAGLRIGSPNQRGLTLGAQAEFASGPRLVSNPQNYDDGSQLLSISASLTYDLTK